MIKFWKNLGESSLQKNYEDDFVSGMFEEDSNKHSKESIEDIARNPEKYCTQTFNFDNFLIHENQVDSEKWSEL